MKTPHTGQGEGGLERGRSEGSVARPWPILAFMARDPHAGLVLMLELGRQLAGTVA